MDAMELFSYALFLNDTKDDKMSKLTEKIDEMSEEDPLKKEFNDLKNLDFTEIIKKIAKLLKPEQKVDIILSLLQ